MTGKPVISYSILSYRCQQNSSYSCFVGGMMPEVSGGDEVSSCLGSSVFVEHAVHSSGVVVDVSSGGIHLHLVFVHGNE